MTHHRVSAKHRPVRRPQAVRQPSSAGRRRRGARGGSGNDRIGTGGGDDSGFGGGADKLSSAGGVDRVRVGRGAYRITPGNGQDTVLAERGDDTVSARGDTVRDRISCGSSFDIVVANARDKVAAGCERVRLP